jgi:EAL domain-containing protein (putative c-di-GMP-specific phosphodiesterase class I)
MEMDHRLRVLFVEQATGTRIRSKPRTQLECDLREAVAMRKILVHFQPQYDLQTGRGIGMEALARWSRFDSEYVPPARFIPVAERCGLINALGSSVLHQACDALSEWSDTDLPPTLSVNISARQVNEDFCIEVARIIEVTGVPASLVELEITETALMTHLDLAAQCFTAWRQLGVRIAIDDFGTGYSSLSYLSRLPVDRLKLDQSFIARMTGDHKTAAIVRAIIALGNDLGIAVLAEGIETEQQLGLLLEMGCPQGQGDLFSKAVPACAIRNLLAQPWGARWSGGLHAA